MANLVVTANLVVGLKGDDDIDDLRVDRTDITVDSTGYTADQVDE